MATITATELRARGVETDLTDGALDAIIADEDNFITTYFGPYYASDLQVVEKQRIEASAYFFTERDLEELFTVEESGDNFLTVTVLDPTKDFWISGYSEIQRRGGRFFQSWVRVTYRPIDDTNDRRLALVELCRINVTRRAVKQEAVLREYLFQAPDDWEDERDKVISRLKNLPVLV